MAEKNPTPIPNKLPPTTSDIQCSPKETRVIAIKNANTKIIPSFNHLEKRFSLDKKTIQKKTVAIKIVLVI